MDLNGKTAVVTGASSGIGRTTAIALAKKGCNLALMARRLERLEEVKKEIEALGRKAIAVKCDVSKEKAVKNAAKKVLGKFKKVHLLVNCAGFGINRPFEEATTKEFHELMDTNFFGTVYCTKAFLGKMLEQEEGCIVNISSVAGKMPFPRIPAYCASKYAVCGFTEAIAIDMKPRGIDVILVCPAGTRTEFFDHPSYEGSRHRLHPEKLMPVEFVANEIVKAIEKGKAEIILPFRESLIVKGKYLMPGQFREVQISRYNGRKSKGEK